MLVISQLDKQTISLSRQFCSMKELTLPVGKLNAIYFCVTILLKGICAIALCGFH